MELSKGARIALFCLAAALLIGALALNLDLNRRSPYQPVVEALRERGYTLSEEDLYHAGGFPDATVAEVLAGQDMSYAAEVSRQGGFPGDVDARGDIALLLLTLENQDIVTIFTRDGEIELCFIQRVGEAELRPVI